MIVLNQIKKIFNTDSGPVTAVNSIDLSIRQGEDFWDYWLQWRRKEHAHSYVELIRAFLQKDQSS